MFQVVEQHVSEGDSSGPQPAIVKLFDSFAEGWRKCKHQREPSSFRPGGLPTSHDSSERSSARLYSP